MPAQTKKPNGEPRQVGIEIEMQGVPVETLATIVADTLGGRVQRLNQSEYDVVVPDQGEYRIEVDYALLKEMSQKQAELESEGSQTALKVVVDALDSASSLFVPCEIVSPPLPMESIGPPMDAIVSAVRDAGANGTRKSMMFAFGVHLNVEPTDMQAGTIIAYMQSFACLFEWIVWAGEVDLSRRITPYIRAFPAEYENVILQPDYAPDFDGLVRDYLAHNPTRNRALDMLPMFSFINDEAVSSAVDDELVNARPTFHYRLANSCVDEPNWSIVEPWERWLKIEQLAADKAELAGLCAEKLADNARVLQPLDSRWLERMQQWIETS